MQNTATSLPVSIRIMGPAHRLIRFIVMQQARDLFDNELRVGADQTHRARFDRFRTFGGFTHHQHRFA